MQTLDLHGVKHEIAERKIEDFILVNELPIRIITGNSLTMKNMVKHIVQKYDYCSEIENHYNLGSFIIRER